MAEREDGRGLVTQRVRELVETLAAAPAVRRFCEAQERLSADHEVARVQAGLRWNYGKVQEAQRAGRHDARLFQEVREAQAWIQRHPLVVEFVSARQQAHELLRATNDAMTEVLGVDVGASGGRAGACSTTAASWSWPAPSARPPEGSVRTPRAASAPAPGASGPFGAN